jgi:hypothetical protein
MKIFGTRKRKHFFHAARHTAEKFFLSNIATTNSTYPANRARFYVCFDKLSRRAAKTPLTSLLAGIKSATRLIACGASPDTA